MCKSGIYAISSKVSPEKIYIGSAVNLPSRRLRHLRELERGKHFNQKMQRHYAKYGINDFSWEVLEYCLPVQLLKREQFFINVIKPTFNICPVAGSRLGAKWPAASKVQFSSLKKGKQVFNVVERYNRLCCKKT